MTWRVGVSAQFSAAHSHQGAGEDCARLHGHNYRVEAVIEGEKLKHGMTMDFRQLRGFMSEILKNWDHRVLNNTEEFGDISATTENIAMVLYKKLNREVSGGSVSLVEIKVWEKDGCWAAYREGGST